MTVKLIICILAGLGAGLSTGFAGLSAAVFITPMLVSFLNVPVYDAVGISLASDVFASAVSSVIYKKNGNIDLYNSRWLLCSVLIFCVVGSVIAYFVSAQALGDSILGYWSILCSLLLGLFFLIKPNSGNKKPFSFKNPKLGVFLVGAYIGFICGFQGAGGGLMLLFALSLLMAFPFKAAVGTSVFIMTFSALIGSVFHFMINGLPDLLLLVVCMISTTLFARIGSDFANKTDNVRLKRITGGLLTLSAVLMFVYKCI